MGASFSRQPRRDRAFRYAQSSDVDRLSWSVPVQAICIDAEARKVVNSFSIRAQRVLRVFASFHRMGEAGYLGTQMPYERLAEAVRTATGERCQRRTLEYALDELEEGGPLGIPLIKRTPWAPPDASVIEIAPDEWKTLTIRICALTPRARALWSKSPANSRSVSFSSPLEEQAGRVLHTQKLQKVVTPIPLYINKESIESPAPDRAARPETRKGVNGGKSTQSPACSSKGEEKETDLEFAGDFGQQFDAAQKGSQKDGINANSGPSFSPPKRPDHREPHTIANARAWLLADLYQFLKSFPTRTADHLYRRARTETASTWPKHWPAALDWFYWVSRWRFLTRGERFGLLRSTILPALQAAAHVPDPPPEIAPALPIAQEPEQRPRGHALTVQDPELAETFKRIFQAKAQDATTEQERKRWLAMAGRIEEGGKAEK